MRLSNWWQNTSVIEIFGQKGVDFVKDVVTVLRRCMTCLRLKFDIVKLPGLKCFSLPKLSSPS